MIFLIGVIIYLRYNAHYHRVLYELDAGPATFFSTVFWPFTLPVALGVMASNRPKNVRTQRRRANEIAEAQHQAKLAEIRLQEHKALDKELALLDPMKALTSDR